MLHATWSVFRHYLLKPLLLLVAAAILLVFLWGGSKALAFVGVSNIDDKINLVARAAYWRFKASMSNAQLVLPDDVLFGEIKDINADGQLVILAPEGKKYVSKSLALANTHVIDRGAAKSILKSHADCAGRFEQYGHQYVAWCGSTLLNMEMISSGAAEPDPRPPTPIYYLIFSEYLWKKL